LTQSKPIPGTLVIGTVPSCCAAADRVLLSERDDRAVC
jgi:hypothetical protein